MLKYLLLASLPVLACATEKQDAPQLAAAVVAELDNLQLHQMTRDTNCRQVVVEAQVNGISAHLLIDTACSMTTLDKDYVAKNFPDAQLRDIPGQVNSNVQERPKIMPKVELLSGGQDKALTIDALVLSLAGPNSMMTKPLAGILGMAQLARYNFTFDLKNKHYSWEAPKDMAGFTKLELFFRSGVPHVKLKCGEHEVMALLDTGASMTVLPKASWPAGVEREVRQQVADINAGMVESSQAVGKEAEVELDGIKLRLRPMLDDAPQANILGIDAFEECVLVHIAGVGFFIKKHAETQTP